MGKNTTTPITVPFPTLPPITLPSPTLPPAVQGQMYNQYFNCSTAQGVFTYTGSTTLPKWASITPAGSLLNLSGVPSETGTIEFTLNGKLDDQEASISITLTVNPLLVVHYPNTVTINPSEPIKITPTITGQGNTITFAYTPNTPQTLTLNTTTGVLTGMLRSYGTYPINITATSNEQTVTSTIDLNVVKPLTIAYQALSGMVGKSVSLTPTVGGGLGPKTYSLATMSQTSMTSPNANISDITLPSWKVAPSIGINTNKQTFTYDGMTTPAYMLPPKDSVEASPIPPTLVETPSSALIPIPGLLGLSLDPQTGVVSGTPIEANTTSFQVKVTDSSGSAVTTVNAKIETQLTMTGHLNTQGVGNPFSFTPTVTGGNPDFYSFSYICDDELPEGLNFNSKTCTLSGTVNTPISNCGIVLVCSDGFVSTSLSVVLNVIQPCNITPNQAVTFAVGVAGQYTIQGNNLGTTPVWTIIEGRLPPGLTLTSAGVITGIPTQTGTYPISLRVTGPVNIFLGKIVVTVVDKLNISPSTPTGTIGVPYSFVPCVTGGDVADYTFKMTLQSGSSMIPGLKFYPQDGSIRGTPTQAGKMYVTITVSDGQQTASLVDDPIIINPIITAPPTQATNLFNSLVQRWASLLDNGTTPTSEERVEAIRAMSKATNILIATASENIFESMYTYQEKYQDTLFIDKSFFIGSQVLTQQDLVKLSGVYSAFRMLVTNPSVNSSLSYLGTPPISCVALINWIQNQRTLITSNLKGTQING